MTRAAPLALALLALSLAGCLEREEQVTVGADGALEIVHRFKGDPAEFGSPGDALPTGAPWTVTERDVPRDDGKGTDRVREARGRFAAAAAVPEGFGAPGDGACLRFTTALQVDRLEGGRTRYTFERRYAPRSWAWRERLLQRHLPEELRQRLSGEREGGVQEATRREALTGLLGFELAKGQALLERALGSLAGAGEDPARVARRALAARAGYAAAFQAAWKVDDVLAFIAAPRAEQLALEARYREETLRAAVAAGAEAALAEGAPDARAALEDRLRAALEAERRTLEATEDLQDESFCLRVTLPGKVLLSDAQAMEDDGRTAVFRFGGKDLADAPLVLRAVAVVER